MILEVGSVYVIMPSDDSDFSDELHAAGIDHNKEEVVTIISFRKIKNKGRWYATDLLLSCGKIVKDATFTMDEIDAYFLKIS